MKRGIGILAMLAVFATGARMAVTPKASTENGVVNSAVGHELRALQPDATSCSAFADQRDNKNSPAQGELASLVSQYLHGTPELAPQPGSLPPDIQFVVATVPDPLHTLLNLQFDRTIESIRQGAQDEDSYDSSWLPWKARAPEYSSRSDQNEEDKETLRRELCPGLILFRKNRYLPPRGSYDDTFTHGLFVFLVGEKPTTGINRTQWNNALTWIGLHANGNRGNRALRVLGPTFSGSAPSVARAIAEIGRQPSYFTNVLLYSGTIRGCSSYRWLRDELSKSAAIPARFADFSQNDAIQVDRYFKYLRDQGHLLSEVAILSEDETAYGGLPDALFLPSMDRTRLQYGANQPTRPMMRPCICITHGISPRFDLLTRNSPSLLPRHRTVPIPLASFSSLKPASPHITIPTPLPAFSGTNSALAQEAQMYGIVDFLRTHGICFVVLRSTSTLDYLFLTRFLHRAYPDAFIVTTGPDILFGREIDSTDFRGVEALTAYPLLPRSQDWTRATGLGARHAHRVFGSDSMEGSYLAMRFLVTDPEKSPNDSSPFIHPAKPDITDYDFPFWESPFGESKLNGEMRPPTWLTVVGRDGYWPVAVLTRIVFQSPSTNVNRRNRSATKAD